MPATRPSDKDKDRSQWWKDSDDVPQNSEVDPSTSTNDNAEVFWNEFHEEQHPVHRPT